jgi:hypothetical protein
MRRREFMSLLGGAAVEFCYLRDPLLLTPRGAHHA